MRRVTLIVNPRAGSQQDRSMKLTTMLHQLEQHGIAGVIVETTGPGAASALAAQAVVEDAYAVFACGGDGTVHEVLQGLVGTRTALGVIPMGTANALARNFGISQDPVRALSQQLEAPIARIAVGLLKCTSDGGSPCEAGRYFTVLAGAGPDGALVYSLLTGQKAAMGRSAYYAHAAKLFLTRRFHPFRILYKPKDSELWQEDRAVSAMCARVGDLGGIFSRLTQGSSVSSNTLRLSYLRPPGHLSLPSWFISGQLALHRLNPWLRQIEVEEFRCEAIHKEIHAQVDGEWIGRLPIEVSLVPDSLSLLIPPTYSGG